MACFFVEGAAERVLMMFLYPFLMYSMISIVFLCCISFSLQLLLQGGGLQVVSPPLLEFA